MVYIVRSGKREIDEASQILAKVFCLAGIRYIIEVRVEEERKREIVIPVLTPEAGGEGKLDEKDVNLLYNGVLNVMKHLKMIDGEPARIVQPKIAHRSTFVTTERGGLFYSNVKVGDIVSEGDVLGEIRNIKGETLQKIIAPHKGMIFFRSNPLPWDTSLGWFLFHIVDVENQ